MNRIEEKFKTHPRQSEMDASMVTDCLEACRACEQACHKMMGAIPLAA